MLQINLNKAFMLLTNELLLSILGFAVFNILILVVLQLHFRKRFQAEEYVLRFINNLGKTKKKIRIKKNDLSIYDGNEKMLALIYAKDRGWECYDSQGTKIDLKDGVKLKDGTIYIEVQPQKLSVEYILPYILILIVAIIIIYFAFKARY